MKTITGEEKAKIFEAELERIYDPIVREFTKLCIMQAPDYIFIDCPASSSGKYHPLDELGADGTIIHMKKIFTVGYELARGLDCDHNRDLVLAACLIHDLRKRGEYDSGHTHKMHPEFAAKLVDEVQSATQLLSDEQHQIIRRCVGYHYGPWSHKNWLKSIDDYTKEELAVYISDYIASKRIVEVNYNREGMVV
jgi:hypothetical protein